MDENGHPAALSLYTYHCRHIKCDVTNTYHSNPNTKPNHKKGSTCGSRHPDPNTEIAIFPNRRWIAALGLGLGFLC